MSNELLLLLSIPFYFGTFLVLFKLFGKIGIYMWVMIATIFANIEVLLVVDAFGLEMTLGNVLFASTFLATDVLSERYGKKSANFAVKLGVTTSIVYILSSQFWLLFTPSANDWAYDSMYILFAPSLRLLITGLIVYYIAQKIDIIIYHYLWKLTKNKTGNTTSYLWLRNLGSTITTQFINSILFTYFAFGSINLIIIKLDPWYDLQTIISIFLTSWIIMTVIAIFDTPFVYLCRKLKVREYDITLKEF